MLRAIKGLAKLIDTSLMPAVFNASRSMISVQFLLEVKGLNVSGYREVLYKSYLIAGFYKSDTKGYVYYTGI